MPDDDPTLPDEPGTATLPAPREETQAADPEQIPPYHVVLLDDDDHTFDYVIEVLMKLFGYPLEKAFRLTLAVHESGRAAVWTGSKEVAEFKQEQVRNYGPDIYASKEVTYALGCVIEPAA